MHLLRGLWRCDLAARPPFCVSLDLVVRPVCGPGL